MKGQTVSPRFEDKIEGLSSARSKETGRQTSSTGKPKRGSWRTEQRSKGQTDYVQTGRVSAKYGETGR